MSFNGSSHVETIRDDLARIAQHNLYTVQQDLISYGYNAGSLRTQAVFTAGNYINYTYDNIGQLKSAFGFESGGSARLNEKFGYTYDGAWNLSRRTNNALVQTFNVNNLNQLTTATRSGTLTVAGTVGSPNTTPSVTVSGLGAATMYGDGTWARAGATLTNGVNTYTATATDTSGRSSVDSVSVTLLDTVTFTYDGNGNLTNDGSRTFEYDFENQLTNVNVATKWRSEFVYDTLMRRRARKEYTWLGGAWVQTNEVRYVYDQRLVVQERWYSPQVSLSTPQKLITYTRGNDLSRDLQAAGGIGGLLARSDSSLMQNDPVSAHAFYVSDATGSITALVNNKDVVVARYQYDPYGNVISMSGPMAEANLYRFSSKELHPNSGLVYYLYRYYEPHLQRWVNRDPLADMGSMSESTALSWLPQDSGEGSASSTELLSASIHINQHLARFSGNEPVNRLDPFGLCDRLGWAEYMSEHPPSPETRKFMGITGGAVLTAEALGIAALAATPRVAAWLGFGVGAASTPKGQQQLQRLLQEKQQVERVIWELRQQLDNGRNLAAKIRNAGGEVNPYGLGKEINEILPKQIAQAERQLMNILEKLNKPPCNP